MPVPLSSFDFWRSSRAIPETSEFDPSPLTPWIESDNFVETGFHITEFPFFTFLFADLHAHMMTMPFAVLALALGWALLIGLRNSSVRSWRPWATVVLMAVAVGSLWAINSWEYPAYALLMVAFTSGAAWLTPGDVENSVWSSAPHSACSPWRLATPLSCRSIRPWRPLTRVSSRLVGGPP